MVECLERKFNQRVDDKAWRSEHLDGMQRIVDDVTGNKYGISNHQLQTIAGTMAYQFKSKTQQIIHILKGEVGNTSPNLTNILKESNSSKKSIKSDDKFDFTVEIVSKLKSFSSKDQSDILTVVIYGLAISQISYFFI